MPLYIYFRESELNEATQLLGVCEAGKSDGFENKILNLCLAMGWNYEHDIKKEMVHIGSILDRFPMI